MAVEATTAAFESLRAQLFGRTLKLALHNAGEVTAVSPMLTVVADTNPRSFPLCFREEAAAIFSLAGPPFLPTGPEGSTERLSGTICEIREPDRLTHINTCP